jgi:protein-disulfide isomerase
VVPWSRAGVATGTAARNEEIMPTMKSLRVADQEHSQGRRDAPVIWLEYGDYQCPHCGHAHDVVKAVQRHLGAAVRFAFRHFPLRDLHPQAALAACAAEAAAVQSKFWEMHDLLFVHQSALGLGDLRRYASQIPLDLQRWERDLVSHHSEQRVQADVARGREQGVRGTPTFFINGQAYEGAVNERDLLLALEAAVRNHPHPHGDPTTDAGLGGPGAR